MAPRTSYRKGKRGLKTRLPNAIKKTDIIQNKVIKSLSKTVKRIDKTMELKQLQNQQSSYSNPPTPYTTTFTHTAPQNVLLNGSIQGDSNVTRSGDKIRMTSVQISGQILFTNGGQYLGIHTPIRVILYLFKRPRGANPSLSQGGTASGTTSLFYNVGGGNYPSTWQQFDTGVNIDMTNDYKILYDRTYTLKTLVGAYIPSTDDDQSVNPKINFYIRKKLNYIADYSRGNSSTIGDMEANALYVAFITDTNSELTVYLDSRVYFKDI